MTSSEQKRAAKKFVEYWKGKGYEKGEAQPFWLALLRDVYGISAPEQFIRFEEQVKLDHTSFIDGVIPATRVLIEQKSIDKDLRAPIKQSDGSFLTPFDQAKRYITELPLSKHPRWVVTCNFASFLVYDMETPSGAPEEILLKKLPDEFHRLAFLTDIFQEHIKREMELSLQAGELVGRLYDKILERYENPNAESSLKSLNKLCVRLVFCLYAEDAGIFPLKNQFHDYLAKFEPDQLNLMLSILFNVLNTREEDRHSLSSDLAAFPYVNGKLFADEKIDIPPLDDEAKNLLLEKASDDFDWSEISPTIFGAVFESTLNPETRRSGGMHYTSIENIHKVIAPLFLTELRQKLDALLLLKKERIKKLRAFQEYLASLTFLDPACGSGNFLTETFLSLRRLENEVIKAIHGEDTAFLGEVLSPVLISIDHFYGIEINDFAVSVARTALWIAESQMLRETEEIVGHDIDFLPLKTNAFIKEGNALTLDWNNVVSKEKLNYIMGNPPFVGKKEQSKEQKNELTALFGAKSGGDGNLDYVTGWYIKAATLMQGTGIKAAFVSTNSITQGEQPAILWKHLMERGIRINFAHRTFRWDSESNIKAHVHCVIIGFSCSGNEPKIIFANGTETHANSINPYLLDAPNVLIVSRKTPVCNVPLASYGSMPIDDGHLILDKDDVNGILSEDPENRIMIRQYAGGVELIRNQKRWCLWLIGISPQRIQKAPIVLNKIKLTEAFRRKSSRPQTLALADYPMLFGEIRQPDSCMLVIPKVSSEKRHYIPISFVSPDFIINGSAIIVPNATLYHFGTLTSIVHMAWMRVVCGRLEMRYQYSNNIVYNNFPWPDATEGQKKQIEVTAQGILDAREKYPDCSLADLYDELTMPPELRKAHQANDKAVMKLYGYKSDMTESAIVADLMKRYQELTAK